ncbi:dTDP-4-dehydrorhamnose reductase [Bacteroidota bacterium]
MTAILVTGANGQLGNEIRRNAVNYPEMTFHYTDIEELDITDKKAVAEFLDSNPVKYLVNCAAYTAVDNAEDDANAAMLINQRAVEILAGESQRRNIQLIHISTDYVFDGENNRPYEIDDKVNPQTVYGRTKFAGEKALQDTGKGIIIRTSWLYSVFGGNFVKTILRLSREREKLQVVFDQTGSPTNAKDLAIAILEMIKKDHEENRESRYDMYHFSNIGVCSWYEFANAIIELSGSECVVEPVESKDYPTPTKRPRYSVMDTKKLLGDYPITIPHWKESLEDCIRELTN